MSRSSDEIRSEIARQARQEVRQLKEACALVAAAFTAVNPAWEITSSPEWGVQVTANWTGDGDTIYEALEDLQKHKREDT